MRRTAGALVAVMLLAVLAANAKKEQPAERVLTGQVTDKSDAPLSGAVVYLQNMRTQGVKSFITGKDGGYRFSSLSPNVDYQVHAEYQGHKSDTKTLSSFDSRTNVIMHLKVNLNK